MPKTNKLDIDKEAVRVLAIEIGSREAARRMGLNEATVCQWSSRYKWGLPARNQHAIISAAGVDPYKSNGKCAKVSLKAGDLLLTELKNLEAGTRSDLAKAARRAAAEAAGLEHVLPRTQQLQQLSTAAGRVFGWDQGGTTIHADKAIVVTTEQLKQMRELCEAT